MRKIIFLITIIVIIFILRAWWNLQLAPVSNDAGSKLFIIAKGEGFSAVADKLKGEGFIKSSLIFKIYAKQIGASDKIQSGTFRLSPADSAAEVLKILTSSPLDTWVTLLEGWRVEEEAAKLASALKIDPEEFLKLAREGYMFPDTYLFPKDYTVLQIAQKMRDNFDRKYTADLKSKIRAKGLTEAQGVILASLVEREARTDKARTEVAGILLKRLKIGMALNVDSTVQYALGYQPAEHSWWKKSLSVEDLKIDSPYNTYLHAGLPPTPICNPSLSSLKAVANADSNTPYLYYYHDSRGNSYYAKTLEEHNANVANHP